MRRNWLALWGAISLAALLVSQARGEEPAPPDFNTHIAPLLQKYCVGCHNPDDKQGGLVLDSYDSLLAGGEHGAAIVPAAADRSRLLLVLTGKAKPAMPPEGNEGPTATEIELIAAWVNAGAKSPTGAAPDPTKLVVPKIALRVERRLPIHTVAYAADGKQVAVGLYRQVRIVSTESRGTVRTLDVPQGNVMDVAYSADGKRLAAAAGEPGLFGEVTIWHAETGSVQLSFRGHRDSLYAVAWSPDGKFLATGGYDQMIQLWDASSGASVREFPGHSGAVFDLAFHPKGTMLASASADRTVKLWDVASGQRLDTFGQPLGEMYTLAFSPDGKRIAAGGVDNRIRVWQISETGQEGSNPILFSRFAHEKPIIKLVYSPDGKSFVSSAEDRTVKLWNAATVVEKHLLEEQPDWAPAIAFAADNSKLAVGRLDGTLALYDANGKPVPPAKPELAGISPRGATRGTTTRVLLSGKNLLDAIRVDGDNGQLTAQVIGNPQDDPGRLEIELSIGAELPRGNQGIKVVTAGGTSKSINLYVDDLPQATEVEPNELPATATVVTLPTGLWGTLSQMGDVDHIAFDAQPGQTVVCEIASRDIGGKANVVLTLFDATGRVVASNNDFEGSEDPLLAYRPAAAGRYVLQINDLAQAGSADHVYRLSIGSFPYVTGGFPLSVAANTESEIELAGFNLPSDAKVKVTAGGSGEAEAPIDANRFRSRRPIKVLIGSLAEVRESEPNNVPEQATAIPVPTTVGGRVWSQMASDASPAMADVDLYRFEAKKGQAWIIETEAERRGSPVDTKIDVLDAAGKPIEQVLLQATRDSAINFRPINSTQLEIRVDNWEEMELNEYMYLQGEVAKIFRLPQGPDSGFLFYSARGNRHCYFNTSGTNHAVAEQCFIVEPHPPGASLVPNGLPVFPLYYSNDDDGQRRGGRDSRLRFTAPADGTYLVRVADVRGSDGDRNAYRLTIRPPQPAFSVAIEGKDPTVRTAGGRGVTFSAERVDDFDEPIRVDITGVPAGFAISTPVIIESGHNEASAVLYALDGAKTPPDAAADQIKVTATAEVNGSPVTHEVGSLGKIKLAGKDKVTVRLEPAEVTIRPGQSTSLQLKIERMSYDSRVSFKFENLPHGVIVDNIGLNGILIPEGQSERQVFLTARPWVAEMDRPFFAVAQDAGNEGSPPVILHVRKEPTVAKAFGK